ncbi:hypothetical protein TTHERM_00254480 (macronuclear) [Tetrahymena thermophila SB210]|uniref:Uncharacterized protein n=1 Tax=Tetrahymena thermophila (strain SB210) TaxID=312017 RepID=Q23QN2_TETTS|nr:hypothetical protein TTHERM_00254480 [Tetrahymena thermophila SB210]EAR98856.1 hypothetical protein TTHERM_00254480 [Tetrahymena thermophila SB210]|eukprot:XP_001019101.1 hypothetical protein TTHERM_00254480 [Tetrahymena thermophila SB210]
MREQQNLVNPQSNVKISQVQMLIQFTMQERKLLKQLLLKSKSLIECLVVNAIPM